MPRRKSSREPSPEGAPDADAQAGVAEPRGRAGWTPRDMLVPYVLLAISVQRAHGYLIEEYLRGMGFWGLEMSTLYRTLRQLESDGLLLSDWQSGPSGPARRVYTLTDAGRSWLDNWAGALDAYRGMIDRFFGLYKGGQTVAPADEQPVPDAATEDQEGKHA